jgi:hypothetical protein
MKEKALALCDLPSYAGTGAWHSAPELMEFLRHERHRTLLYLMPGAASRKRAISSGQDHHGFAWRIYGSTGACRGRDDQALKQNRSAEIVVLILGTPAPLDVRCN